MSRVIVILLVALVFGHSARAAEDENLHDTFARIDEINRASLVMTVETGIVPRALGRTIAKALDQVAADAAQSGAKRPDDYLKVEPLITAIAGPDATRMHAGRSRQDIIPTVLKLEQRDRLLALAASLDSARASLLDVAEREAETVVPAYTNGVQAQPTTLGHVLLGYAAAMARDSDRLREAWARTNLSPLGAAALGTSSFPVDRKRLADLLGFDAPVENSYDAGQLAPLDLGLELTGIAANLATTAGSFAQDLYAQYHQTRPWILLREGALTGPSSIMPQKRNPVALYSLRMKASDVVGGAMAFTVMAHNVDSGMPDYKRNQMIPPAQVLSTAAEMCRRWKSVLDGLVVDRARAADEVAADYSTTTELADTLQREADVPFRLGHHFASELVTYGRGNGLRPADLPFDEVKRIYAEAASAPGLPADMPKELPLTEARFRQALSAPGMIAAAKGLGGPQKAEVTRMLGEARMKLASDRAWLAGKRDGLAEARSGLDTAFATLATTP
ncbi:argininosuccinate lyase [Methylobacterium persicinum]|uniref:argininosuccinate lyase n=1 Tax=Methylobacterium persicinum TaxID=374426 RepID=A0ABU0HJC3_9HYPH|nr:argininosuccinate lyase [Methylobacterium persicinum]MDQ0442413.1 argininosuccinate lyase [Methylobacterium persicinum]GJE37951.1 Argininosuccinate lyase [Methylobacterium persicinum]